jgi:hypothetical protein
MRLRAYSAGITEFLTKNIADSTGSPYEASSIGGLLGRKTMLPMPSRCSGARLMKGLLRL